MPNLSRKAQTDKSHVAAYYGKRSEKVVGCTDHHPLDIFRMGG
jgi:hypothetical protein